MNRSLQLPVCNNIHKNKKGLQDSLCISALNSAAAVDRFRPVCERKHTHGSEHRPTHTLYTNKTAAYYTRERCILLLYQAQQCLVHNMKASDDCMIARPLCTAVYTSVPEEQAAQNSSAAKEAARSHNAQQTHAIKIPLMTSTGMRDSLPPMGKFLRLRWVCAPQYRVSSTTMSPNASDSVLALDGAEDEVWVSLDPEVVLMFPLVIFAERGSEDRQAGGGEGSLVVVE